MSINMQKWLTRQQVLVIIGGHAQRLLPYLKSLYPLATMVLVIDSSNELGRIGRAGRNPRVRLFSLGVGHTAQTLCKGLPQHVVEYISSIGGMAASGGMGQSILIGRQAGKLLVESADFKQFVRQSLIPELRKRAGGALEEVRFILIGSLAGATYTGAELPVANSLASTTRQLTSAITRTEFLATGSLTYEGLGDRIWLNGAAALNDLVAYVRDPRRHPREIRSLRLMEFAMCGVDEALRDAFLAQVEQAAHGVWMEYDQQRTAPNRALNGTFGNIQVWEAEFGKPLDLCNDIVPVVSDAYVRPLVDILGREASIAMAERLELVHTRIKVTNGAVEDILSTAVALPVKKSLADLQSPSYRYSVAVWARVTGSHRICLADLQQCWAKAALTVEEIDQRMQLQRRLLDLLRAEIREQPERQDALMGEAALAEEEFTRQHRLLNPKGIIGFFKSALSSTPRKLARLAAAAYRLREISDQVAELRAEQAAIDRVHAVISAEYDYLRGKLTCVVSRLKDAGPELGDTIPAVTPFPIDIPLADLWDATDGSAVEFMDVVRGCVQNATLAGLALITNAAAPRPEEIARQIASGQCYCSPSVPWGGQLRADHGRQVHILPPTDLATQGILAQAVRDISPNVTIAFADAAPAVVNIVGVTMRLVRELTDVLTEPYQHSLLEAANSPCIEMFFPEGMESLPDLGIRLSGNEIVVEPQT